MRGWLLTFGSLLIWAGWFLAAYGLHGLQCEGPLDFVSRQVDQWVQTIFWMLASALCAGLVWLSHKEGVRSPRGLSFVAMWLNVIGLLAMILTGAAVLFVAPC
jgi:hypothetical protein